MLVTAAEARPLRSLAAGADRAGTGDRQPGRAQRRRQDELPRGALLRAHRAARFRTADRRDLIPFGGSFARAEATVRDEDGIERHLLASVSRAEGRRHLLDGSPADPATLARSRPPVAVFSPDRLALVKGPPAERRAHLDGFVAARWPIRGRAAPALRPGAGAAQRPGRPARGRPRRARPARRLGRDPGRGRRGAGRRASRGGRRARRALRRRRPTELGLEGGARARVRAAGAGLGGGDPRRPRRAARGRPAARPDARGARTSTSSSSPPPAARCAATARRASSARRSWPCSSPSATSCSRPAGSRPLLLLDDVMSELDPGRRERLVERLAARRPDADHRRRRGLAAGLGAGRASCGCRSRAERGGRGMTPPPRSPAGRERPARGARPGGAEDAAGGAAGGLGGGRRRADRGGRQPGLRARRRGAR